MAGGKYLTTLIIFGLVYFLIVGMVAPDVPANYAQEIEANTMSIVGAVPIDAEIQITTTTEGAPSQELTPENVGKFEPFTLSHVHAGGGTTVAESWANVQSGEMIAPIRDYRVMFQHENMYAAAYPVYFSVPINEIIGPNRTTNVYGSDFIVFQPALNSSILEKYYNESINSEQMQNILTSRTQSAGWQEQSITERTTRALYGMAASMGTQILKYAGGVFNPLLTAKWCMTYDFGISDLFGLKDPFRIGQIIAYIWSIAVFIEIFSLLPESSDMIGTLLKYGIGLAIAVPWLAVLAAPIAPV